MVENIEKIKEIIKDMSSNRKTVIITNTHNMSNAEIEYKLKTVIKPNIKIAQDRIEQAIIENTKEIINIINDKTNSDLLKLLKKETPLEEVYLEEIYQNIDKTILEKTLTEKQIKYKIEPFGIYAHPTPSDYYPKIENNTIKMKIGTDKYKSTKHNHYGSCSIEYLGKNEKDEEIYKIDNYIKIYSSGYSYNRSNDTTHYLFIKDNKIELEKQTIKNEEKLKNRTKITEQKEYNINPEQIEELIKQLEEKKQIDIEKENDKVKYRITKKDNIINYTDDKGIEISLFLNNTEQRFNNIEPTAIIKEKTKTKINEIKLYLHDDSLYSENTLEELKIKLKEEKIQEKINERENKLNKGLSI